MMQEVHSERIVVHGQSMGAAATGLFASSKYASQVDAVIMDSPFESMEEMFLGVWREMDGVEDIPESYAVACGDWYLKQFYGFGFEDTNVLEKMKNLYFPAPLRMKKSFWSRNTFTILIR